MKLAKVIFAASLFFSLSSWAQVFRLNRPLEVQIATEDEFAKKIQLRLFLDLDTLHPILEWETISPQGPEGHPIFIERVPGLDRIRQLAYMAREEWEFLLARESDYFDKVAVKIHQVANDGERFFRYAHVDREVFGPELGLVEDVSDLLWHLLDSDSKTLRAISEEDWGILQEFYQDFKDQIGTMVREQLNSPDSPVSISTLEGILDSPDGSPEKAQVLHRAVLEERADIVELLAREGVDVNAKNRYGETPLHMAAKINSPQVVETLLSLGADFGLADEQGNSPLMVAIYRGHTEAAELLILVSDVEQTDAKGRNALHVAADYNRIELISPLLARGADPDALRTDGDSRIETALMIAIRRGHRQFAEALIPHSDVNTIEFVDRKTSKTALYLAVEQEELKLANLLLESEADPNLVCHVGGFFSRDKETPLVLAARQGQLALVLALAPFSDVDTVELSESGERMGKTALFWAAEKGHLEIVDVLLEHGADTTVTYRVRTGFFRWTKLTPAGVARKNGHYEIARRIESGQGK